MPFLILTGIILFTCCNKEDNQEEDQKLPDPENSKTIEVNINEGFKFSDTRPSVYINSNIQIDSKYYYFGSCWNFIEIGEVPGLGNITEIPPDYGINNHKWQLRGYEIKEGFGYAAYFWDGNYNQQNINLTRVYVRFYVERILTDNNIIVGAVIKYQCPFVP